MTGVVLDLKIDSKDAGLALRRLAGLDMERLTYNVGALLESSVQRRIDTEKQSPDGEPWAAHSPEYAQSLRAGRSILVSEQDLLESIQNASTGTDARVGTNLVYGAVHQMGSADDGGIPARPYLGLSARDEVDIEHLIYGELDEVLQ